MKTKKELDLQEMSKDQLIALVKSHEQAWETIIIGFHTNTPDIHNRIENMIALRFPILAEKLDLQRAIKYIEDYKKEDAENE